MAKKIAEKPKVGRPSEYSEEVSNSICERLMQGESLRAICRDESMPALRTVCYWLATDKHPEFLQQYARAREIQAEILADEIIDIADETDYDTKIGVNGEAIADKEWIQRSSLRVDARKWVASKLLPKKYGTFKAVEVSGTQTRINYNSELTKHEIQSISKALEEEY